MKLRVKFFNSSKHNLKVRKVRKYIHKFKHINAFSLIIQKKYLKNKGINMFKFFGYISSLFELFKLFLNYGRNVVIN